MIVIKSFNEIDNILMENLDNFIKIYFDSSRLSTYEYIIYYINDNAIIGFLGLQLFDNNILLNQLCVDINNRNKGIAKQLLLFTENIFKNHNLFLYTHNINNIELRKFYYNRGFKEIYKDDVKIKMVKYI